jgi:hypothetical protein
MIAAAEPCHGPVRFLASGGPAIEAAVGPAKAPDPSSLALSKAGATNLFATRLFVFQFLLNDHLAA